MHTTQTCITTFSSNTVSHDITERQSRFISGSRRSIIAKELHGVSPSTLYNKKFTEIPPSQLQSGVRDDVGLSPGIFKKIKSEV